MKPMLSLLMLTFSLTTFATTGKQMKQSVYDFTVNKIDGSPTKLEDFKGKTIMIVNVASKCGLTSQYEGLEKLYEKYQEKGLVVLGFPANQFLGQEPGTNTEIQEFCKLNYGIKFPMFEKIVVKGDGIHPLYQYLTTTRPEATMKPNGTLMERLLAKNLLGKSQDIHWNFEKFLINKKGEIVERFSPELEPQDPLIVKAVEKALE